MNPGAPSYAAAVSSNAPSASDNQGVGESIATAKKRKHRGGKKRRNRRQSFAATADTMGSGDMTEDHRPSLADVAGQSHSRHNASFYRLHGNNSNTSLESEALLDHREQPILQPRRQSVQLPQIYQPRASMPFSAQQQSSQSAYGRSKLSRQQNLDESDYEDADDRTPLMSTSQRDVRSSGLYGATSAPSSSGRVERQRRDSRSSGASNRRRPVFGQHYSQTNLNDYDVNNPPSVPASPVLGPDLGFDDVMLPHQLERSRSPEESRSKNRSRDALIDIDEEPTQPSTSNSPPGSPAPGDFRRRMTFQAAEDVCFPLEGMSEIGQEDYMHGPEGGDRRGRRRRRRWPDLGVLEAWSHEEKEQRTMEGMRTRKVSEPLMVGGRLRPQKQPWHREADDAPYRFTYFNDEFDNTIHSQTISELVQPGQTFRNLFIPDPPIIEDSTDGETDDEEDIIPLTRDTTMDRASANGHSRTATMTSGKLDTKQHSSGEETRSNTPRRSPTPTPGYTSTSKPDQEKRKRYGPRPAFWLDVLSPTDAEMKIISKAFSIHPLTAEDILMQEQREKVELFKHYYFINYRTFEQDENSEDYLEPVNLYVVVFREGVISFHFSMTPHPANVRRRIRQLQDYLILSPDWISYGIIDDITDAYAPLIQRIEEEVDDIDEAILRLHSLEEEEKAEKQKSSYGNEKQGPDAGRDMLRRVGECRKKVMSLYRLLGNKADVIKGFAKRCTEQWDVAPRSEIGLYLGDIQDHIVTMTGNLSHYEK
jgi:magnesium transporter